MFGYKKIVPVSPDRPENQLDESFDLSRSPGAASDDGATSVAKSLFSQSSYDTVASAIGITAAHQAYFAKLAKEHHLILLWRPVNSKAASKLAQNYMGKRLNLKSKSSEFGPIAGDIPSNPRLGKAARLAEEKIDYLTAVNQSLIEYTAAESDTEIREKVERLKTEREKQEAITKLNDGYRVTEVEKYVDGMSIFYATDTNGNILTLLASDDASQAQVPRFFKRTNENAYQEYHYELNEFVGEIYHLPSLTIPVDQTSQPFPEGTKSHPVKILAYKRFKYDDKKGCIIENRPITADYDELACCPRNDYPYYNNDTIRTQMTQAIYQAFAAPGMLTEEKKIEIVAKLMIEHDNTKYAEEQALVDRISMGYMTDHEHALKTVENIDTEGATNHGPEVYNFYYTENFSTKPEDIYFAHLPDGTTAVFNNDAASTAEQKICDFINQWRAQGYPIPVNPCWGWNINEKGVLTTEGAQVRAKTWRDIMHDLQGLEKRVKNIDHQLGEIFTQFSIPTTPGVRILLSEFGQTFSPQQTVDLSKYSEDQQDFLQRIISANAVEKISNLIDQDENRKKELAYQRTLIGLQLQIERIRLGAHLTYSGSSLVGDEVRTYTVDEKDLNMQVSRYVKEHVNDIKQTRISLLEGLQVRPVFELAQSKIDCFVYEFIDATVKTKANELTIKKRGDTQNSSNIPITINP